MTAQIKIQRKGHITLPAELRRLAGVVEGDTLKASFRRGEIILARSPMAIDPSQFPTAGDEYIPEQRKIVDSDKLADSPAVLTSNKGGA